MAKKKLFVTNGDESIYLHSENGTAYELSVDNSGSLTVTNEATGEVTVVGGGGLPTGGAHQQFVTDAEGKALWEDRLAYAYTGMVEILPETDALMVEMDAPYPTAMITTPFAKTISGGEEYVVNYNGQQYKCVAVAVQEGTAEEPVTIVVIGNLSADGGEDTGEPFVMITYGGQTPIEDTTYAIVYALDGAESVTISITGEGEKVSHMDRKYIKDMYGEDVETTLYLDERNPVEIAVSEYDAPGFGIQTPLAKELEPNVEYVVVVNGKRYKATATEDIINGAPGFSLGINSKFSMSFFGEGAESDYHGSITVIDPSLYPVKTVALYREIVTVHKILDKYLPGGAGGLGSIYMSTEALEALGGYAYGDAALTEMLTYDQGRNAMKDGGIIRFATPEATDAPEGYAFPQMLQFNDTGRIMHVSIGLGSIAQVFNILFSDSVD